MKFKFFTVISIFLIGTQYLSAQTYHKDSQDGLVVFQLKINTKRIISTDKQVNFKDYPLFTEYLSDFKIEEVKQLHPNLSDEKLNRTYQIKLADITEVDNVIKKLEKHPIIEYAELKELHHSFLTPNDTYFSPQYQWSLFKIQAEQAWDISVGSSNIVVAAVDNAIDISHPDLQNILVAGYDAANNSGSPAPCGSNTGAHGTHVSGIIGAETNNGMGVSSIGNGVSVMPVKIGNCSGSLTAGYDGIIWAADNGADVINMSWGGSSSSQYGQNVVDYAWNKGSILVAASGNDNVSTKFYPAGYNNIVSVASTNSNDKKSGFSNYGTWVKIAAPGSQILSTIPSNYDYMSGTSMASPMVAGLLGLMKSYAQSATNTQLINCLYSSSDAISDSYFNSGQLGAGRINAYNAMSCLSTYVISYDAAITDIVSPIGTICSTSFTPKVKLKNYGSTTLTSAIITYNWGGATQTYNWSGNLLTGQSATVTLPTQTVSNGSYVFSATVSSPNGQADGNNTNNSATSNFVINGNGQEVTLNLNTDCWGSETTWDIKNSNNNIVANGGPYSDINGGTSNTQQICLSSGCYTFTIYDVYGDGMNGSQFQSCSVDGYYELLDDAGITLFAMTAPSANFGSSTSHNFCLNNVANDSGIASIESPTIISCSSPVAPIVKLKNYGTSPLTSATIRYKTTGSWQTFSWTGNLATNQTALITLPVISLNAGVQTLTVETQLPNGVVDGNATNDQTQSEVSYQASSYSLPFVEDFENSIAGTWTIDNPDGSITWERATISGTTPGNKAMKVDLFNYQQAGSRDGLISPKINLTTVSDATMSFDYAYRRYNQTASDSLIIYVSTDCGNSWNRVFAKAEDGSGSFATQTTNTAAFTPSSPNDWCFGPTGASCSTVNLNSYVGNSIFIKFESYNAGSIGNNLFVDNINITGTLAGNPPTPAFSENSNQICVGDNVSFTDLSTDFPTSWNWTFPGGAPATSNLQNPTVTYSTSGSYNVTLEVANIFGTQTMNFANTITVYDLPQLNVSASDLIICEGENTTLTVSGASTYTWDNGLGGGSTHIVAPTATTTYNVNGTSNNCSNSDSIEIVVNAVPTVPIISQNGNVLSVNLQTGETAEWFFNGNSIGFGNAVNIVQNGNYEVVVSNAAGCQSSNIGKYGTTDIDKDDLDNALAIFPNPTENTVNIVWNGSEKLHEINIYDAQGRKVLIYSQIENDKIKIDLSSFERGMYVIQIPVKDQTIIRKIVKR